MKLTVARVSGQPGGVRIFELRHPRRPALPAFEAGAHVDIHLPDGRVRQYSLFGDARDRSHYAIAVKREVDGRGGSNWLHDHVAAGQELPVSAPRSHFGLSSEAGSHLLLAGGIGITPMLAMARVLAACGGDFALHYFARSRSLAPLLQEIAECLPAQRVHLHFDDEPSTRVDIAAVAASQPGDAHLYYCGPPGFMGALRTAAADWPEERVHFEAFQPAYDENFVPEPFSVKLRSTGQVLDVPADASVLAVLRAAGVQVFASCENGVCGSCECGYLAGEPVHLDAVLSSAARASRFIPCISRANGQLTLDL
ncbi:2Fe-2S iron-sulfur cluster-binding protein [Bosea sp. RCC_152_1]|uniref:PDR/VanB family oxidoreductase n=1 Tax=Bosea sp. RCC_152_1 TaxID=3239228 RepID=UPI00352689DF